MYTITVKHELKTYLNYLVLNSLDDLVETKSTRTK